MLYMHVKRCLCSDNETSVIRPLLEHKIAVSHQIEVFLDEISQCGAQNMVGWTIQNVGS